MRPTEQQVSHRRIATLCTLALFICVAVAAGWITQTEWLTSFGVGTVTTKVNTVIGLAALASALLLALTQRGRSVAPGLASAALLLGCMMLLQYAGLLPSDLDQLLVTDHWAARLPGRPSEVTALALLLGGLAALLHRFNRFITLFHSCAWLLLTIAWLTLTTFLFSPDGAGSIPGFETVALPTALCLMLLGLALLQLRGGEGLVRLLQSPGVAGVNVRLLVPLGVALPSLLGWLSVTLRHWNWVDKESAFALLTTLLTLGVVWLAFVGGRRLETLDELRTRTKARLRSNLLETRAALERATAYLEAAPGAMLVVDIEGRIQTANRQASRILHLPQAQLIGMPVHELVPERFRAGHGTVLSEYFDRPAQRQLGDGPSLVALRGDGKEIDVELTVNPFTVDSTPMVVCGIRDVSERLAAKRELQAAKTRLQLATSAANIGIWEWVISTDRLIWDEQMLQLYGGDAGSFTEHLAVWQQALLPEDREEVAGKVAGILEGREAPHLDFRIRRRDGSVRIIEMHCTVVRNEAGEALGMIGTNRDITEQRVAEERVATERRRFEATFHSMYQMTWVLTPTGEVTDVNQAALEFAGVERDAMRGQPFWKTPWSGDGRSAVEMERWIRRAAEGRFVRYWTRLGQHKTIPVDLSIKPVYAENGSIQMLITEARDVSDAESTRAALIESEARFRNALDHSAIGLALVDLSGRFMRVNEALSKILGRSAQELHAVTFHDITHPDDLQTDLDFVRQLLEGKRSHYHLEKRYLRSDGGVVWCLLTGSLVRSPTGDPQYFVAQVQDFTERKQAEARLQRSLRDKEVLLREIHHRVKNNLQIVNSILRLAERTIDDTRLHTVFAETGARIQTMAKVHEQLYSTEELSTIDFARQLQELCVLTRHTWKTPRDRVKLHVRADPVELEMDHAIPLSLIANELISNSLKHAFPGDRNGEVWIELTHQGEHLQLTVRDDGVGLPHDFSVDSTRSLGMRIVTRLTQQLRGTLLAKNAPGAEFMIEIKLERLSAEFQLGAA